MAAWTSVNVWYALRKKLRVGQNRRTIKRQSNFIEYERYSLYPKWRDQEVRLQKSPWYPRATDRRFNIYFRKDN